MWERIKCIFQNEILVTLSVIFTAIFNFLFPNSTIKLAAGAVLIVMGVDLVTKIIALSRQSKGLRKAIKEHKITSSKFAKGTLDKLIVFGIMLIICAAAYNLLIIEVIATWFTQIVFTIMFLRDVLSILENLSDAGIQSLGLFKHIVKKKIAEEAGIELSELDDCLKDKKKDADVKAETPTDESKG